MNSLVSPKSHRREEAIRLHGMADEEGRPADLAGLRIVSASVAKPDHFTSMAPSRLGSIGANGLYECKVRARGGPICVGQVASR